MSFVTPPPSKKRTAPPPLRRTMATAGRLFVVIDDDDISTEHIIDSRVDNRKRFKFDAIEVKTTTTTVTYAPPQPMSPFNLYDDDSPLPLERSKTVVYEPSLSEQTVDIANELPVKKLRFKAGRRPTPTHCDFGCGAPLTPGGCTSTLCARLDSDEYNKWQKLFNMHVGEVDPIKWQSVIDEGEKTFECDIFNHATPLSPHLVSNALFPRTS